MYNKKYIGVSFVVALLLITGAIYSSQSNQKELTDNVSTSMAETVTASVFLAKNTDQERIIIDVRTPEEFEAGHIEGAKNMNIYEPSFMQEIENLDKNAKYSLYCRSGNRSGQALSIMESLGFEDVIDLGGGIGAWAQIGQGLCTDC